MIRQSIQVFVREEPCNQGIYTQRQAQREQHRGAIWYLVSSTMCILLAKRLLSTLQERGKPSRRRHRRHRLVHLEGQLGHGEHLGQHRYLGHLAHHLVLRLVHPVPCLLLVHLDLLGHRKELHRRGKRIDRRTRCRPSPSWRRPWPWQPSPATWISLKSVWG